MTNGMQIDLKRMLQRRGTKAELDAIILEDGEFGLTTDDDGLYIGNDGRHINILTQSSIEDTLTSTSSSKVASARSVSELRGQLEDMKSIYDGYMQNFNGDLSSKQDVIVNKSDTVPLDFDKLWYDTSN